MAKLIKLEIITPSKIFYQGDCELVIVRTLDGDEGFMAGHSWACKLLAVDALWIQEAGQSEFKVAAIAGGYIDVRDSIIIYTDSAEWEEEIDSNRAAEMKEQVENWLEEDGHDPHEIEKAQIALAKALTRMKVAQGGYSRKG